MKDRLKNRKSIIAFSILAIMLFGFVASANSVTYAQEESSTLLDTKEYILENINTEYANADKLEVADLITVNQTLADKTKLKDKATLGEGESLISSMYEDENTSEAFITMMSGLMVMYNTDDNSDYYVAFVDTMHNNTSSEVVEYAFTYSDIEGNVISDAIYDEETGIAYIPKKYTEENKNGQGIMNVQIQLLQACDANNLNTTYKLIVDKDESIEGSVAESGYVDCSIFDDKIYVKIANDVSTRKDIEPKDIKLEINGEVYTDWAYNNQTGEVEIDQTLPLDIDSVKVYISKENNNESAVDATSSEYIEEQSVADGKATSDTVWKVSSTPTTGMWTLDNMTIQYYAGAGNRKSYTNNPYVIANTNNGMASLVSKILNGGGLESMYSAQTYMSWQARFDSDYTFNANGVNITIPASAWDIKCAENVTSFDTIYSPYIGHTVKLRIFEVNTSEKWMLVGIVTPKCTTQAGAALFKVRYEEETGNLRVAKKDNWGNFVSGVTMHITGPDFDRWVTSGNDYIPFDGVKPGTYTITETSCNTNMYRVVESTQVTVTSGNTSTAELTNYWQRGAVTITKYDTDNRGATLGDATIEGAKFNLYAAQDISEGQKKIYSADELVKSDIVTKADGTTDAVTNLPIGTYYYVETQASTGFLLNSEKIYVSVTYAGDRSSVANTGTCEIGEKPIYNSIEITKYIDETSNTQKVPLEGAEFTATLVSSIGTDNEYSIKCTAPTDENGYCIIENLPYGTYIVSETTVPSISLKCADFTIFVEKDSTQKVDPYVTEDGKFNSITLGETVDETKEYDTKYEWLDSDGNIVEVPKVMQIKIRKVDKDGYEGNEAVDYTQGDAVLKGAIYQIYRYDPETDDYTEYVYDITVDHQDSDGYWCAESDDLATGKYMVKEKIKSTETVDGVTYNYSYAEGYLTDPETYYFDQNPEEQKVRLTYHSAISKEEVIRGSVEVIKYINSPYSTDEVASKDAILRLTLKSNPDIWYEVKIDEYGYGNILDTNDDSHTTAVKTCYGAKYYPNTIPFGEYELTETSESNPKEHTSFYIQAEDVTIENQVQKEYRIEADEPVPAWLKIVKKDKDTGKQVKLPGAKFKIWDVENSKWVELMKTPSGEMITEFETNDEGYLYTPQELQPGTYVVYETQAPEGYYLEDSLRLPENEKDLGNTEVSGQKVVINKVTTGLRDDVEYPKGGIKSGDLVVEVEIRDTPLKVNLQISKTAEKLTGVTTKTVDYPISDVETQEEEKYTPKYSMVGLEGVGYKIYAVADTYTPDGIKRYSKDELVATITTDSEGIATAKELYPGEFRIEEYKTPTGYLKDDNIPNVTLVNTDNYVKTATANKELSDDRQKLQLTFNKVFEDVNYANNETPEQKALFGVYTKSAIKDYTGKNVLISEDKLVDLIWTDENGDVTSTIDLPEGTYYVKELYVSYPYTATVDTQDFELKYNGNSTQQFVVKDGDIVTNRSEGASLTLLKLSSTTMDNVILNGKELDKTELDEKVETILNEIKGKTQDEIREYLKNSEIKFVAGAKYTLYLDEKCTTPLRIKNDTTGTYDVAEIVTNSTGLATLDNLPLGKYWLKETEAPSGYELSESVTKVTLTLSDKNTMVYQALIDDSLVDPLLTKTDIFTGEVIPNCTFEIKDDEGNLLLSSITDDTGRAYIPLVMFENGKTYSFTETNAPDIYNLNTEPHYFTANISEDGTEWLSEPIPVSNTRKSSTVKLIKTDLADSTPIPNCKFELRSLETDFVVEGVTDANGEYVFENIPYGKYTYTELEAPEKYLIDTTPHEIEIDSEEIEIQITNELNPDADKDNVNTGDIAVYVLSAVALISTVGIIYIVRKNKALEK